MLTTSRRLSSSECEKTSQFFNPHAAKPQKEIVMELILLVIWIGIGVVLIVVGDVLEALDPPVRK